MTANQLAYQANLERERAARAQEALTAQRNAEEHRANFAREEETKTANRNKEYEMFRSNRAREIETHRANIANEALAKNKLAADTVVGSINAASNVTKALGAFI